MARSAPIPTPRSSSGSSSASSSRSNDRSEMQALESRQLMAADPVALPFKLDFSSTPAGTVVDKDGQATGFSGKPAGYSGQVDINTAKGTLALTADYTKSQPTVALDTAFDGTTRGFAVTARLVGPLSGLSHAGDQTGISFGPDANNYVRVAAIMTSTGESLQFSQVVNGQIVGNDAGTYVSLGTKFASISTLDLQLTGDSVTGALSARYSINGKSWQKVGFYQTVPDASRAAFFNPASRAGVVMSDKHAAVTSTFDSFQIDPGLVANVPKASVSRNRIVFSDLTTTASASKAQTVRITNGGSVPLVISSATFSGDNAGEFTLTNPIDGGVTIQPGQRQDFYVTFNTTTPNAIRNATLTFTTNDPGNYTPAVTLRGLGLAGTGGTYEPALQRIINLYNIPIQTGQADSNDNSFPVDTATANSPDEVAIQQLVKADGNSAVTVEMLGVFANQVSKTSFGWYEAGNPQTTYQVGQIAAADAQSLSPMDDGALTFDPGANSFGIYGNFTLGSASKPINRNVYSESSLNSWETNAGRQKKVRFYQLKNADGTVVPNAYVFAFEEYNLTFDQNDIVGIIRNVKPAAVGPELGLENLDGVPAADQLVFSKVEHKNPQLPSQADHDTVTLRVRNTGTDPLTVSQMVLSNAEFQVISGDGPLTIAAGSYADVKVKFVYSNPTASNGNSLRKATLTLVTNDADEPTKIVKLSGMWESYSENNPQGTPTEPSAEQIVEAFGYNTAISTSSRPINTKGVNVASGDEVMSQIWQRADTGLPVNVRLLATYHQVYDPVWNTHSTIYGYDPTKIDPGTGKPYVTYLMSHNQADSQSLLPRADNSNTAPSAASWIPTSGTFGFNVNGGKNGTFSEDKYNTPNDAGNAGHAWRFYVAKDAKGNIIPDTYLACQDYVMVSWANYDYQDNILLITNIKPTQVPQTVQNVKATSGSDGVNVAWTANTANDVTGYNVYRQLVGDTAGFTQIATVSGTSYSDTTAVAGQTYTYYVTAAAYQGGESAASAQSSAVAGAGTVTAPPAATNVKAVAASSSSVGVTWTAASSATGYRVERKTGTGAYVAVGTVAAGVLGLVDNTVAASTPYAYRVIATNSAGDAPASVEAGVTTPAAPTVPTNPTTPPSVTALTGIDIGAPAPAGRVTTVTTGRDYDVTVGGVDIYGTADSFNYLYTQKTGDFDVAVQVAGLTGPDASSQAGLMVRDSLAANAKNVEIKGRVGGLRLTSRTGTGGTTASTGTGDFVAGTWLRLQRVGSTVNTYTSADGQTWALYGSVTVTLGSTVYVGLATCGHSQTTAGSASYRNFGDTGSVGTTPTTPTAPTAASNLAATVAATGSSVALTWADNAGTETGYRVERQTAGGAWGVIATLAANTTAYTDAAVTASTTYGYRVVAVGTMDAAASNVATVTTPTSPTTPPPTTVAQTLTAVADTYVYDGATGANYGTSTGLQVKKSAAGYNRQAYLTFDVSTLASLGTAKLRLYTSLNAADTVQLAVYSVAQAFNESTTTWASKPANAATALGTAVVTGMTGQWVEIDLTATVKAAVAAGQKTLSLALLGTASSTAFVTVASRESGANGPQLVVA